MAGGALIPLLGKITPDSSYSIANAYIYTNHMSVVIQLPTNLFIFLHDYSHLEYIYNIYILYNPDGLYSNKHNIIISLAMNLTRVEFLSNLLRMKLQSTFGNIIR